MDSQSWLSSCCGLLLQHTSKVDSIALTRLRGVLPFLASAEFSGNRWKLRLCIHFFRNGKSSFDLG